MSFNKCSKCQNVFIQDGVICSKCQGILLDNKEARKERKRIRRRKENKMDEIIK